MRRLFGKPVAHAFRDAPPSAPHATLLARADGYRDARDYAAAAQLYREAVALQPQNTEIRIQYGNMLKDSGQPKEAERQYGLCLEQRPRDWDVLLQLARALVQMDRFAEAEATLAKALAIEPEATDVKALLAELGGRSFDASGSEEETAEEDTSEAATAPDERRAEADERERAAVFERRFGTAATDARGLAAAAQHVAVLGSGRAAAAPATVSVSVIVPIHGRVLACLSTLESLAGHRTRHPFEVIVYDDATPESLHADVLAIIPWVRHIRGGAAQGLAKACRAAADHAAGEMLVYLPAGARACEGWLDDLLGRNEDPQRVRTGFVRRRLVGRAGSLGAVGGDPALGARVVKASDKARANRTVLVIDHLVPEPDRDAGSRNMMDIMRNLQAEGWFIKFWPRDGRYQDYYTPLLRESGVEVLGAPWFSDFEDWFRRDAATLDLVLLSRPTVAPFFLTLIKRWSGVPVVFYGHDLHSARMRRQAVAQRQDGLMTEAEAMEEAERRIWREVDLVLYPSREEADEVRRLEPKAEAREITPFCFDSFGSRRPPPRTATVLFVAGFAHDPNVDAAVWLVEEVLPLVRKTVPKVRLSIVGSNPTDAVRALAGGSVEVTGYVSSEDLARRYREARVAVIPLRFGAGVKLKVVEALHEGLPLVTTPVGAQGLEGLNAVAAVRSTTEDIAAATAALLRDDEAWTAQAARQLGYARRTFSRRAAVTLLTTACNEAIDRVTADGARRARPAFATTQAYLRWLAADVGVSDADFVDRAYRGMLRRPADAGGLKHYVDDLRDGHIARERVIATMEGSGEYAALQTGDAE